MKMKKGNICGFTIVELIVAISIVTILIAVSTPNLLSRIPEYRLRSAARELHGNLQFARMTAIKSRANCTTTFNPSPSPGNYVITIPGKTLKTVNLSSYKSGVTYSGAPPATIVFAPSGIASTPGSVILTNAGSTRTRTATVLISGVVMLQ
jgi:prepilin-type N-terminal cleavage/methylation domain-containing protein